MRPPQVVRCASPGSVVKTPFAADFTAYTCTACHAQAATTSGHAGVGGYVYASATCLRCHADAQVTLASSHVSGQDGDPPHQGATCLECHDVYRTDKTFGADFASDPALASKLSAKQGCYHCHSSAPPRGN